LVVTLEAVPKRPHTNDLFELFPDLPWTRRGPAADRERILQQMDERHVRADVNVRRQRASSLRVREFLSARRRR
jgi:hypothetical protein